MKNAAGYRPGQVTPSSTEAASLKLLVTKSYTPVRQTEPYRLKCYWRTIVVRVVMKLIPLFLSIAAAQCEQDSAFFKL